MRYSTTPHFDRAFAKAPPNVQRAFQKQIGLLLQDIRHPSLRAKKYDEPSGVWQARVNKYVRFYFLIKGDMYLLIEIRKHAD